MSLRARMTVSFAVILAVPLLAATLVVHGAFERRARVSGEAKLRSGFVSAKAQYQAMQERAVSVVDQAAQDIASRPDVVRAFTDPELAARVVAAARRGLKLMALVRPDGGVTGLSASEPRFLPGVAPPPFARVIGDRPNGWAILAEVRVRASCGRGCTRIVGSVVGGTWLDQVFVERLRALDPALTVLAGGSPVASTAMVSSEAIRLRVDGDRLRGTLGGRDVVAQRALLVAGVPGLEVLVSQPADDSSGGITSALVGMFFLALIAGAALAYLLARLHTRPIAELSAAALAVSRGDFERRIERQGTDEIGELADAFNTMTDHLRTYVGELESSRDEIRKSVRRLGQTLQSTHDLTKLLSVVLETAMVAAQGRSGAVYLLGASRKDLYVKVGRNLGQAGSRRRLPAGAGIAGRAVEEARPILVPHPSEDARPHENEIQAGTSIAVPLESQGHIIGAIAIYGRADSGVFSESDLEMIRSLAQQAAVGIDNVLLHQEAQRLSITDGLTGAWNYRYFQMRLAQEVERAIRFGRPMTMMIIDIDHFKQVNDRFGHQRGDSILVEVARRTVGQIRVQVDTLARYGGEEFVLILPETGLDGACVVAGKILEAISSQPFAHEDEQPVRVTVSIGLATFPEHGTTPRALVRAADQAMYEAKARGRNRLVTAEELDRASQAEADGRSVGAPPVAAESPRVLTAEALSSSGEGAAVTEWTHQQESTGPSERS